MSFTVAGSVIGAARALASIPLALTRIVGVLRTVRYQSLSAPPTGGRDNFSSSWTNHNALEMSRLDFRPVTVRSSSDAVSRAPFNSLAISPPTSHRLSLSVGGRAWRRHSVRLA